MGFDITNMLNNKSLGLEDNFAITQIVIDDIFENENNFYDTSEIEELKQSIKAIGLQQNIVVSGNEHSGYTIISGHRRYRALKELIDNKEIDLMTIPCRIIKVTELEEKLILILSNCNTRELSSYEKMEQIKKLKEIALEIKNSDNSKIKGGVRNYIAKVLDMSKSEVGRYEAIDNKLSDDLKQEFKENNINTSVAYETSKLPIEKQKEVKKIIEEKGTVSINDVKNIDNEKIEGVQLIVDNNEIVDYEEPKEIDVNAFNWKNPTVEQSEDAIKIVTDLYDKKIISYKLYIYLYYALKKFHLS